MKKNILPFLAIVLLSLSSFFTITQCKKSENSTQIKINDKNFQFPKDFQQISIKTINDKKGYQLDKILIKAGCEANQAAEITLIAADDYQKTVKWDDLTKGILTEERSTTFEHLPKAFNIKDLVKIEVK
ncbi:MAG: hypothetical protein MJB14_05080 [Spirochaetes bacterium]|nr:hypothetical protein [Spirochaetota bacterium]